MTTRSTAGPDPVPPREPPLEEAHPRGTLVIMILFGLFFAVAWVATYLFVFLQRGAPQP